MLPELDLMLVAKAVSVVSQTSIIISVLWIIRHFKRYTCPVYITAIVLFLTSFVFSSHLWITNTIRPEFLTNHIMVDLTFFFTAITLIRCSLGKDFLKSQYCGPCNEPPTKKS
jgi:hypothetical protein